jgi:hypothetical protein
MTAPPNKFYVTCDAQVNALLLKNVASFNEDGTQAREFPAWQGHEIFPGIVSNPLMRVGILVKSGHDILGATAAAKLEELVFQPVPSFRVVFFSIRQDFVLPYRDQKRTFQQRLGPHEFLPWQP